MLDTISSNHSNKQVVNAVSGTLVKSHPKSYFERGHINSNNTKWLMGKGKSTVVLQAMLIGDMYMLYEVVDVSDFGLEEVD